MIPPSNKRRKENRLEVCRLTAAVGVEEIPALTETQIYNATKKAMDSFDKNYLLFRKQNKRKGIIVPSIAVSAEGRHPVTGKITGILIGKEMERASLWSSSGMANLVRLHEGTSCYENPTVEEQRRLGPPGKLLFNAEGNKQLAMKVEKALQAYIIYREMIAQEDIKLLQLTAGNGTLRGNPPYIVGYRFFFLETIKEMGFVFKDALSPKQLLFSKLPKKSTKAKKVVKKSNNPLTLYYSKKAEVELLDSEDNESDSEDESEKKISVPRVSESPQLEDLVDTDEDGDSRPAPKIRRLALGVYSDVRDDDEVVLLKSDDVREDDKSVDNESDERDDDEVVLLKSDDKRDDDESVDNESDVRDDDEVVLLKSDDEREDDENGEFVLLESEDDDTSDDGDDDATDDDDLSAAVDDKMSSKRARKQTDLYGEWTTENDREESESED